MSPLRPAAALAIAALLLLAPAVSRAQRTDTTRTDTTRVQGPPLAVRTLSPDTVGGPPVSPRTALLRSLLIPGWGQLSLGRRWAAAIFIGLETGAGIMTIESSRRLDFAERYGQDSILVRYDPPLAPGRPLTPVFRQGTFGGRVAARRQHVEDYVAILAFNHLISAVDAFIAAHLWDLPTQVSIRSVGDGALIAARITW
ncbi:MAG TPA: DUF5683 domain-containing protein [Gemmatimonadaceae bacterium]|nr:DUF5683 domain-containing protein [Gemmatimonadaceae bacterium]